LVVQPSGGGLNPAVSGGAYLKQINWNWLIGGDSTVVGLSGSIGIDRHREHQECSIT
jgi:hypothetical protein